VTFDPIDYLWKVKFHLTIYSGQKTFNAKPVIDKLKDTSLGSLKLSEIHLSNRAFIDLIESGERIPREEFKKYEGQDGFYACDGKLTLSEDDY
jgi:hypothetical protein